MNFPRHFIRHANFAGELTRHSGPIADFSFTLVRRGELFNRDATFIQRQASVLIDHGSEGVPADD